MDLAQALAPTGARRPFVRAQLLVAVPVGGRLQVTIDGSYAVWLPFVSNTYVVGQAVLVLRAPAGSGSGQVIVGPVGMMTDPPAAPPAPPPAAEVQDPDNPDAQVQVSALIRPTFSGTWRTDKAAWDRWPKEGGLSTLWQGSAYGSGVLKGLATYSNQVKNLGALRIVSITVSTPVAAGSGTVTLQGSAHGGVPAGAPVSSGTSNTGTTGVALDATTCEDFRTGLVRGLCATGAGYRGTYGTAQANGMTLAVVYTRPI